MINVVAFARAKTGEAGRLKTALEKLVAPTHAEAGNHGYRLHTDADDANLFVFYEAWESRAALDAHMQTPHLKNFVSETGDALASPLEVHVLDALAGHVA